MSSDMNYNEIKDSMKKSIYWMMQNIFSDLFIQQHNLLSINSLLVYLYKTASFSMLFYTPIPNSMRMRCCMLLY